MAGPPPPFRRGSRLVRRCRRGARTSILATLLAVCEAAGWRERRVHSAGLRSECQPAAERLNEAPARRDPSSSSWPVCTGATRRHVPAQEEGCDQTPRASALGLSVALFGERLRVLRRL